MEQCGNSIRTMATALSQINCPYHEVDLEYLRWMNRGDEELNRMQHELESAKNAQSDVMEKSRRDAQRLVASKDAIKNRSVQLNNATRDKIQNLWSRPDERERVEGPNNDEQDYEQ